MPRYRINVIYNMGMSEGGETHEFSSSDDNEAMKYAEELEGKDSSCIKRNVQPIMGTLSRVLTK